MVAGGEGGREQWRVMGVTLKSNTSDRRVDETVPHRDRINVKTLVVVFYGHRDTRSLHFTKFTQ